MSIDQITPPPPPGRATTIDDRQAGAGAVNADRAVLMRQYEEQRQRLAILHSADAPDWKAIDDAIDRLARLQSDIKATFGLIGNNPIED